MFEVRPIAGTVGCFDVLMHGKKIGEWQNGIYFPLDCLPVNYKRPITTQGVSEKLMRFLLEQALPS